MSTTQPYEHAMTSFGPMSPADAVTASISQKELVIQLRQFAQDPKHQSALIENMDCLKILTEVLATAIDSETCVIALQTLQFLASNPKYRSTLNDVPKLTVRVEGLTKSQHSKISILASNLLETLNSNTVDRKPKTYQPRPLHSVYLKIVNMKTTQDQNDVEQIGIAVKGVISVSANIQTHHATFYCASNDLKKKIIHALRAKGFQIQDDSNDKDSIYLDDGMSTTSNMSSLTSERQDLSSLKHTTPKKTGPSYVESNSYTSRTAITKYQPDPSVKTLSQRLEEEKKQKEEEEKEQEQTQSLLSKVIGYIW